MQLPNQHRLSGADIDGIAFHITGRDAGCPQQHGGRGSEVDAVAGVALFQEPHGEVRIGVGHAVRFQIVACRIPDEASDGLGHGQGVIC